MQRVAYIDRRLRYKRDYPSAGVFAREYLAEAGETFHERTWKRDIEWLRDEGAPIKYDPHRHGYYYTNEAYTLPAINLTAGDLLAILVAERALVSYRNSPFHDRMQTVFGRLAKLLPDRISVQSTELSNSVTVIAEPVTEIQDDVWSTVQQCLHEERSLVIHYQAPGHEESAARTVDPYHLVGHRGEWYLLSWAHEHQSIRIYALTRIQSCSATHERFTRPDDFHPEDYIDPSFGVFVQERPTKISIRFSRDVASMIRERTWHPDQTIEQKRDGSIVLHFSTNQQTQTLYWVARWGPNAEILKPRALRERAAEWFASTAANYNNGEGGS